MNGVNETKINIAVLAYKQTNYDIAKEINEELLTKFEEKYKLIDMADVLTNLSNIYIKQNDLKKGEELLIEARDIYTKLQMNHSAMILNNNLAIISVRNLDYDKAASYFESTLAMLKNDEDKYNLAKISNNYGTLLQNTGKFEQALKQYQYSLKLREEMNDNEGIATCLINLGDLSRALGKNYDAISYNLRSYKMCKEIGDREGLAISSFNIAQNYGILNKYDKGLSYLNEMAEFFKGSDPEELLLRTEYAIYYKERSKAIKFLDKMHELKIPIAKTFWDKEKVLRKQLGLRPAKK